MGRGGIQTNMHCHRVKSCRVKNWHGMGVCVCVYACGVSVYVCIFECVRENQNGVL